MSPYVLHAMSRANMMSTLLIMEKVIVVLKSVYIYIYLSILWFCMKQEMLFILTLIL
jgi:predicted FMN-binding regulatory protein PaiB